MAAVEALGTGLPWQSSGSYPDKFWKDVLDSRKNRQEECLGVASVIILHAPHISRLELGMTLIDGYVHGNVNIRLAFAQTLAANESSRTS